MDAPLRDGRPRRSTAACGTLRAMTRFSPLLLSLAGLAITVPASAVTPTLRQAAAGKFRLGTAVVADSLPTSATADLIAAQFDALTPEYESQPDHLEPRRGQFNFGPVDRIADFAAAHHQRMIGHALVWNQMTPAWSWTDAAGRPLSRDLALARLKEHIDGAMGHYRGRVQEWIVVNEALSNAAAEPALRDTPAQRAVGDDYVARAFTFAAAADPGAELVYNDFDLEQPVKRDRALRLVSDLRAQHVRIDALGIQGHWTLAWPPLDVIERAITAFGRAGVKVSITELDVDVLPRPAIWNGQTEHIKLGENGWTDPYRDGCPPAVLAAQARRYGELFRLFARHADVVERVTLWGVHDGQSWLNDFPVRHRRNYPLLFDRQLQPKPAFTAAIQALRE